MGAADFITSVIFHYFCELADVSLSKQHGLLYRWGSAFGYSSLLIEHLIEIESVSFASPQIMPVAVNSAGFSFFI